MEEEILEQEITLEDENITVVAGTQDYEELDNKPSINNVELIGNKSLDDLGIDQDFVKDNNYVHTDNNYTTEEKTKLAGLSNYDDTEVKSDISSLSTNKADKSTTYTKTEVDNLIPDVSSFIDKNVNDLTYYTLGVDTGHSIELSINSSTYVLTLSLKNSAGTILNTNTVDLPLETMVINGTYDSTNKKIILTLQNGSTIDVPVGDLINGLQTEITSNNKLSSDLVDDTNHTNKFVTSSEKENWNGKQDTLVSGTNIKTINNTSLLGSGNINISEGLVMLTYGTSTWNDFITAYNKNKVVYCVVNNSRMAFMAYKSSNNVEFQYYRSLSSASESSQVDEVYVYKLTNTNVWTTDTRKASTTIATGNGINKSYTSNTRTMSLSINTNLIATKTYVDGLIGDINTILATLTIPSNGGE